MSARDVAYDRIGAAIAGLPAHLVAAALADHLGTCIAFSMNEVGAAKDWARQFGENIADNIEANWRVLKDAQIAFQPAGGSA